MSNDKRATLQRLLEQGTTQVVLDPRVADVILPPQFAHEPLLRLNVSYRFPDSDLRVDWWGVQQSLNFPTGRFLCKVPWAAIFAMGDPRSSSRLTIWDESAPPEMRGMVGRAQRRAATPPAEAAEASLSATRANREDRPIRAFRPQVIPGSGGAPEPEADAPEDPEEGPPEPPRGRPFLRVVK